MIVYDSGDIITSGNINAGGAVLDICSVGVFLSKRVNVPRPAATRAIQEKPVALQAVTVI